MVGRVPLDELLRIGDQPAYGPRNPDQVLQIEEMGHFDGDQAASTGHNVPAKRQGPPKEIGVRHLAYALAQGTFGEFEHTFELGEQSTDTTHSALD